MEPTNEDVQQFIRHVMAHPVGRHYARCYGAFGQLVGELKREEGYGDAAARATAAKIGRETLGQEEMTRRSVAGRKEHEGKE
jgi:hypothetical protein